VSPSSGSAPGLQVIWVSPDGETAPLDAPGRVQLVHAGGPPNNIDVDVRFLADGATEFFDGPPVTDALGFQAATAFARFPSGVPSSVRAFADTASPPGASEPPEAQLSLPNGLEAGGRQRLIAYTDGSAALQLSLQPAGPATVSQGFGADVFHAAAGLESPVDLHVSTVTGGRDLAEAELQNLAFGTGQAIPADDDALVMFEDKLFTFTPPGMTSIEAEATVGLTGAGSVASAGQGYLFVVLPDGGGEAIMIVTEDGTVDLF